MKCMKLVCTALALTSFVGCNTTSSDSGSDATCTTNTTAMSIPNSAMSVHPQLAANQSTLVIGGNYINEITTTVTVCIPGTATCQTIPNVLVDTGSNGLRLFDQVLGGLGLTTVTDGVNPYGACVTYADTTSHWGPIKLADVRIGGETASNVSIQVIKASFGSVPPSCTNLETDPNVTGYNGIVGVGLLANDCPNCANTVHGQNPTYYSCPGSSCTYVCNGPGGSSDCSVTDGALIPAAKQVTNPIAKMPTDNNGVMVQLPNVATCGSNQVTGTLTFGVGTSANNIPSATVKTFTADGFLNFRTTFEGITYSNAFIDSGSNAYYFPSVNVPVCNIQGFNFYCPGTTGALTATQAKAATTSGSVGNFTTNFVVTNSLYSLSSSNTFSVFPGFAGDVSGGFDWGLPFFFGRTIYVGIFGLAGQGAGSPVTQSGPYWAYDPTIAPTN